MKYVDIVRSPASEIRVFTSSERLAKHWRSWKTGDEDRDRWKMVKMSVVCVPQVEKVGAVGKLMKSEEEPDE